MSKEALKPCLSTVTSDCILAVARLVKDGIDFGGHFNFNDLCDSFRFFTGCDLNELINRFDSDLVKNGNKDL